MRMQTDRFRRPPMATLASAARALLAAGIMVSAMASAQAQQSVADSLAQYRQMLADDNPAELSEAKGAELWKTARGPKHVSLEQCDLGAGPGVVKGAYVVLPRYFKDTDRVQDLESRLVTCMMTLQGFTVAEASKNPFAPSSDMQALVAYIAGQSRGLKMTAGASHPKELHAIAIGKSIFNYRAGTHDFACATCHGESGKRIRLQELPNLRDRTDAQATYGTWPGYRVSQGEVRSMQHRLWDCFRQQRFPELQYNSEAMISLMAYLANNARDGVYNAPSIKR
jgi:sulfur-oxidizing protein SoxA